MTIREYIDKNLPNLNWNILPQIFEANDVELTEEIEAYLRETPKNTNWNVMAGMNSNSIKPRGIQLFEETLVVITEEHGLYSETFKYKPESIPAKVDVLFNGVWYKDLVDIESYEWIGTYGIFDGDNPNWELCPFVLMFDIRDGKDNSIVSLFTTKPETYIISVYDVSQV